MNKYVIELRGSNGSFIRQTTIYALSDMDAQRKGRDMWNDVFHPGYYVTASLLD